MKNNDLQFLQSELSRVSEWIQFADKKAGFVAIFYSAILGFLWSQKDVFFGHIFYGKSCSLMYALLFITILFLIVVGMCFLFSAVKPRTDNKNTNKSFFFYGTISKMKIEDYLEDIEKMTEEQAQRQIAEQIHTNSVIADAKMTSVKKSTYILIVIGALLLILFFL